MRNFFLVAILSQVIVNVAWGQSMDKAGSTIYRMNLEECLEYALGNSYDRQNILLNQQLRDLDYEQAKMERLPGLSATIGENLNHSKGNEATWDGSYGLSTNITLYNGSSITNSIEQSRLVSEQTVFQTQRYDNELTIQILQSFLSILGSEELLKYQRSVLKASEEQLAQGKALYAAGSILESDYLLLEAQYASDYTNIVENEITRDNSLLTLKNLMSLDPQVRLEVLFPDSVTIDDIQVLPVEEFVVERAMATLPDLIISGYSVDIAEMNVKIAKSSYAPTISLGGSIGTGHNTDFNNYWTQLSNRRSEQIGLSLSIPIFNKGRTKTQVAQNKIALRQAELDNEQNILDIKQTVIQEYQNVVSAKSRYDASDIRQNAYLRSFEAYRAQFDAGAITTVDLLQQQNNYINAVNDFVQNKYSFIFRRKVLDVYMGYPVTM